MKASIGLFLGVLAATASAQTTHKHYEQSEAATKPAPGGEMAPRLQNLGTHTFKVRTKSKQAQAFMNQGLNLAYGFNHAEAGRAFKEAARLDPSLAMAYWGQAYVLGPNINAPMTPEDEPKALEAAKKAASLKGKASAREQAYIDAIGKRYTGDPKDRVAADRAYADAMREVVKKFPDDLDAATIYAESLMDTRPWNYWLPRRPALRGDAGDRGEPREGARAQPESSRGEPPLHPRHGGEHAGEGGARGGPAPQADAGGGPHGAHALAHLPARGPLRGRRRLQPGRGHRRRGLHHAVPGPGPLPDGLLPAQHPLPLVRRHRGRARPARDRLRAQDRVQGERRDARAAPAPGQFPDRALLRAHPLRPLGRDAQGAAPPPTSSSS